MYDCCESATTTVCPQHAQQAQLDAEEARDLAVTHDLARGLRSGASRIA